VFPVVTGRFNAEIIPLVTVPDNPSGEPTAIDKSPITTLLESPIYITGRLPFAI
jgi:hypothetical protein